MREIQLSQGQVALVDDADFDRINRVRWHAQRTPEGVFYAIAAGADPQTGKRTTVYMHRMVMRAPKGSAVDHRDGNRLNNQRDNLRFCNPLENVGNSKKQRISRMPYKGILRSKNKWRARIGHVHLGMFCTPEEAAAAYDKAALERFGEFACVNFPVNDQARGAL
jgi:hypothetical protein